MTAVAVLQEQALRKHFLNVYWMTVGADAVDDQLKQLMIKFHKQLSGKSTSSGPHYINRLSSTAIWQ